MSDINIFELLGNAEKAIEAQRESLTDEQKKEFDKKLEESNFKNLSEDLRKKLNGLNDQFKGIIDGHNN